jgi:tetratricopeptide (TPR) repeat protein
MDYHPPRMDGIPEDQFEIYKDVVNGGYRFHDMLLDRLLQLAGPEATVLLVSDHGFHSDHLRPRGIPREPAGPAVQHRSLGVFCLKGPGIKQDERIDGATLLDVTPTVLTLFGLPIGADMDGRVFLQAFEDATEIETIPSWEQEPGPCGMHPPDLRMEPAATQAVLQQFVALGYMQQTENQEKAVEACIREAKYNLARAYLDGRKPREALPLLEALATGNPKQPRFAQYQAQCLTMLGRPTEAKEILARLITTPAAEWEAEDAPAEDGVESVPAPAASPDDQDKSRPWADLMMGAILFQEDKPGEALEYLLRAEKAEPLLPNLHLRLGEVYLRMKWLGDCERAFWRALEIDVESSEAFRGLAIVSLQRRQFEQAAEHALSAVGLQHYMPDGHFCLGVALARLGHFERASLAFETAVSMTPGLLRAHRWLAVIHARPGGDRAKSREHRLLARELGERRRSLAAAVTS